MRRAALLVPVLLLAAAPAAVAGGDACHGSQQHVDSLELALGAAPSTLRAGRTTTVPVSVTRAGMPAADVEVSLLLRYGPGRADVTGALRRTDDQGRVLLPVAVPAQARGPVAVTAEGYRDIAALPCAGVHEHGDTSGSWGRAVR